MDLRERGKLRLVQERKLQETEGARWTCGRGCKRGRKIRVRRREIAREGQVEVV